MHFVLELLQTVDVYAINYASSCPSCPSDVHFLSSSMCVSRHIDTNTGTHGSHFEDAMMRRHAYGAEDVAATWTINKYNYVSK